MFLLPGCSLLVSTPERARGARGLGTAAGNIKLHQCCWWISGPQAHGSFKYFQILRKFQRAGKSASLKWMEAASSAWKFKRAKGAKVSEDTGRIWAVRRGVMSCNTYLFQPSPGIPGAGVHLTLPLLLV